MTMFSINRRHVDWQKEYEDWDLECPCCGGKGCDYCEGMGYVQPYWNIVWDTGLSQIAPPTQVKILKKTNCFVAFNTMEDEWYLGLTGCGMDLTPSLAAAWVLLGFWWLPLDWVERIIDNGHSYTEYVAGKAMTKKIEALIRQTIRIVKGKSGLWQKHMRKEYKER